MCLNLIQLLFRQNELEKNYYLHFTLRFCKQFSEEAKIRAEKKEAERIERERLEAEERARQDKEV